MFYGLGVLLNIIMGFVMGGTSMYYINMSMFFAFATLYPEMQVLLFGILPLKVKWLAWLDAAMFAFDIFFSIFSRQWITAVLPLVALLNYFIFFWDDLMTVVRRTSQRAAYRANPQTINFKKGTEAGPGAPRLPPQVRGLRHHRCGRPRHGVPVLFQVQRLLLLLHEAHQ